ncbi:MAG TPA: twin-arginine translocase subunit TatC [Gammaproteobacteria bacterium]|nr:twin-arginine translocase subunit TatC [Gammaproteobacteria bacterium]
MTTSAGNDDNSTAQMGFLSHLIELRDRLLRMVIAIVIGIAVLFPFANEIYTFLAGPLTQHLPEGSSMIAIDVASPFLTPFKMVLMLSIVLTVPYLLHQVWSFIAPGLYKHEKRLAVPLLASSVILFYVGMVFAYYVVFPLIFAFFTSVVPDGVEVMTDINRYLDFVVMLFLAFGIAFEVPIVTVLLVMTGMTTVEKLKSYRPYIIVGAFVAGMLLTPPDVVSQVLLAFPMWFLFELGLLVSQYFLPKKDSDEASEPEPTPPPHSGMSSKETAISNALMASETFKPLTDEEMDAELDRIEDDESKEAGKDQGIGTDGTSETDPSN